MVRMQGIIDGMCDNLILSYAHSFSLPAAPLLTLFLPVSWENELGHRQPWSIFTKSVREALSDMLAVAAGFLPPWVDALLSGFPFLLPLDLRLRYFRSLAFGVTRSVAYLQQGSVAGDGAGGAGGGGDGQGGGGAGGAGARGGRRASGGGGAGGRAGGARGGAAVGGLGALRRDIVQVLCSVVLWVL